MNDKILTIKKSTLVDIANEVRAKTGSTELIKVADLDDAVKELSGGGVVEVDELPAATVVEKAVLPASTYDVNETGDLTLTSEPVYIGNIYINTALSVEETINTIKKVTQELDAVYNKEMTAYKYVIDMYEGADDEDYSACTIELFNNLNRDEDDNLTGYSDQWVISLGHWDSEGNAIFDEYIFDSTQGGWNPEFNGVINFNKTKAVQSYINWNRELDWGGDSYFVNGVVSMNSELVNLIYTGEEVPNPEIDADSVYKLPDGTLWIYKKKEWSQLKTPKTLTIKNNNDREISMPCYLDGADMYANAHPNESEEVMLTFAANETKILYASSCVIFKGQYYFNPDNDVNVYVRYWNIDQDGYYRTVFLLDENASCSIEEEIL